MHIALIGTRGVPATYGGFETAAEEVGARLVELGHTVTVYCRGRTERTSHYRGMRTVDLPAVKRRSAETLSHTALSVLHAAVRLRPDVAIVFNSANSPLLPVLKTLRIPVALHTDGLEWRRGKWGPIGRRYYLIAEALGVCFANVLISDAKAIADYYRHRYRAESAIIAYGASTDVPRGYSLNEMGLESKKYHLVVARIEPENHVDVIIRGYLRSASTLPLVVVGSVPYETEHSKSIASLAQQDGRVRRVGSVWDQQLLDALYSNAAVYFHGHSVGGTNPSLLRAMGVGAPVAAYDVSFNREVLGPNALGFWRTESELAEIFRLAESDPERWVEHGKEARQRIRTSYRWDDVAERYARLAVSLLEGHVEYSKPGLRGLGGALRAALDPGRGEGSWSA